MTPKVIFIVGPTASGKTDLAVKLARYFNGEIISADSRQVYEGLDLGTGKDGRPRIKNYELRIKNGAQKADRKAFIKDRARYIKNIPQYLIDIVRPGGEMYNLARFLLDAQLMIKDIKARGRVPIVVGGTGLYISALIKGYELPPAKKGRGEWGKQVGADFVPLVISINTERAKLYEAIDRRLGKRIKKGMISEVKNLLSRGVSPDWLIKLGLEYRFTTKYLQGQIASSTDYFNQLKFASHAYARRQLTWLRHQIPGVEWVSSSAQAANLIVKFLKNSI
jgi:tRNA dimethylallyltransferase